MAGRVGIVLAIAGSLLAVALVVRTSTNEAEPRVKANLAFTLEDMNGVVRQVTDQEMLDAKAKIAAGGFGCEPASAASVAGARLLCDQGIIGPDERVVCILTGHQLKDPTATVAYHTTDQEQFNKVLGSRGVKRASYANRAVSVNNNLDEILKAIQLYS